MLPHEQFPLYNSNLATRQDFAAIKSDLRTIKWMLAGIGFGMLTVMLGVSSLVMKTFGFL